MWAAAGFYNCQNVEVNIGHKKEPQSEGASKYRWTPRYAGYLRQRDRTGTLFRARDETTG